MADVNHRIFGVYGNKYIAPQVPLLHLQFRVICPELRSGLVYFIDEMGEMLPPGKSKGDPFLCAVRRDHPISKVHSQVIHCQEPVGSRLKREFDVVYCIKVMFKFKKMSVGYSLNAGVYIGVLVPPTLNNRLSKHQED